jgi:hypothetical protein
LFLKNNSFHTKNVCNVCVIFFEIGQKNLCNLQLGAFCHSHFAKSLMKSTPNWLEGPWKLFIKNLIIK